MPASKGPIAHDSRWPVVSLGEIAVKIGSGATPRGGAESYLPNRRAYALVRSQNVFDRYFDDAGLAYITDEQALGLRGVVLQPSDILLNITGDGVTFGRACIVPTDVLPACVNQHVSIIRLDARRADAGYVLGFLTHPDTKPYIESFNAGGSRRAVTKAHIESFRLPLPPVREQRAIGRILGTLDDKIDLNRRMSETLEEIARTAFRATFLNGHVDAETHQPLRDHVDVTRGLSYKGSGLAGSGTPMHNLNSIYEGGGYKRDGLKYYTGDYQERHVARPGDVLVANTEQGHERHLIGFAALAACGESLT